MNIINFNKEADMLQRFLDNNGYDWFDNRFYRNERVHNLPLVNISEDNNFFVIEMAAPGYKKEDFNVNTDRNVLTISVSKKNLETENQTSQSRKVHRREFYYGSFSRSFSLPDGVDASKISGEYSNGILTILIPKAQEQNLKQTITIK